MDLDSEGDSDEDDEEEDEEAEEGAEEGGEEETAIGEAKTTKAAASAMVVMLQRMIGNDALGRLTNMAQEVSDGKISLDDFQVRNVGLVSDLYRACMRYRLFERRKEQGSAIA